MNKNDDTGLKNLKYKNSILNGVPFETDNNNHSNITNVDLYLEKESNSSKNETWSKLDKSIKIKKMNDYVNLISKEYKLSALEIKTLKKDLNNYLDKKQLQKIKDVVYDKETGIIKNIPNLLFNKNNRKFTIKRTEKTNLTTKSLGPKKSATKKNITREKKDKTDK